MTYKIFERKAEVELRKAQKLSAPEWLLSYAQSKIDRAKYFRAEADSASAKELGMRSNRMMKALDAVLIAIEVLEEFRHSKKE